MQKFVWRLQRVLEVRQKQEQLLRGELAAITEKAVSVRGRIMMLKMMLRSQMAEIKSMTGTKRLQEQASFLECVAFRDREIGELENKLKQLELLRKSKLSELLEMRKARKGLERLRENAKQQHGIEMEQLEQKALDENTHIAEIRRKYSPADMTANNGDLK